MTCPNCNSQYNDNLAACPFCGAQRAYAPVAPQQTYAQPQQTVFPEAQQAPYQAPQGAFFAPPAPVKKKKKGGLIAVIIIAIFAIIGFIGGIIGSENENKEQTHTFVKEEDGYHCVISYEAKLVHKGDRVNTIITTIITEYDEDIYEYVDQEAFEEELEAYIEEQNDKYDDYDFITYEIDIDGFVITETTTYNDTSDNVSDLVKLGLMTQADFVSYEKTKDNYEDDGFELVED